MSELSDFQKDVIDRLARIESSLVTISTHEQRITNLEAEVNKGKGFSAAISITIGILSALIGAGVVKLL